MRHLLLALAFLPACGSQPQALPVDAAQLANAKQTVSALATLAGLRPPAYPENLSVTLYASPSDLPCAHCGGVTLFGVEVLLSQHDEMGQGVTTDLNRTALSHELIHVLFGDGEHKRKDLWGKFGLRNTAYNALNGTAFWPG